MPHPFPSRPSSDLRCNASLPNLLRLERHGPCASLGIASTCRQNSRHRSCCRPLRRIEDGSSRVRVPTRTRLEPSSIRLNGRSEEHTSELQSLMRSSYVVFCLKKKKQIHTPALYTKNTTSKHI